MKLVFLLCLIFNAASINATPLKPCNGLSEPGSPAGQFKRVYVSGSRTVFEVNIESSLFRISAGEKQIELRLPGDVTKVSGLNQIGDISRFLIEKGGAFFIADLEPKVKKGWFSRDLEYVLKLQEQFASRDGQQITAAAARNLEFTKATELSGSISLLALQKERGSVVLMRSHLNGNLDLVQNEHETLNIEQTGRLLSIVEGTTFVEANGYQTLTFLVFERAIVTQVLHFELGSSFVRVEKQRLDLFNQNEPITRLQYNPIYIANGLGGLTLEEAEIVVTFLTTELVWTYPLSSIGTIPLIL